MILKNRQIDWTTIMIIIVAISALVTTVKVVLDYSSRTQSTSQSAPLTTAQLIERINDLQPKMDMETSVLWNVARDDIRSRNYMSARNILVTLRPKNEKVKAYLAALKQKISPSN